MNNIRELLKILRMTDMELLRYLYYRLKFYDKKPFATEDYLYFRGDAPIMLIAHLDTVGSSPPDILTYKTEQRNIILSDGEEVLGADDRAGVFAILSLVDKGYRPHILFTMGEEIGGVGAQSFCADFSELWDINFLVELDRRGREDAVFYDCGNVSFIDFICGFGFKKNFGTFSDICILSNHFDIASCNLSVGYSREHTADEQLNLDYLHATIKKTESIIIDSYGTSFYNYQKIMPKYVHKFSNDREADDWYDKYVSYWDGFIYNEVTGRWEEKKDIDNSQKPAIM